MLIHEVDIGEFVDGKVEFFSLTIGTPSFWRDIDEEALGLQMVDGKTARKAVSKIVKDGRKCITLPAGVVKDFTSIRNKARSTLASFASFFPFLPVGVFPIPTHRLGEMMTKMNDIYADFLSAKKALIESLPTLKADQMALYEAAAAEVYADKAPGMNFHEFKERYMSFFERSFPNARAIEKGFTFGFQSVGKIKKNISLMSREEFLKDETTKAKVRVIADGEQRLRDEFYNWVAEVSTSVKVGMFKALYPIVNGIAKGDSIGKRELQKIEAHIEKVKNLDLFGDKDFDTLCKDISNMSAHISSKITEEEKKNAEASIKSAFVEVKASLSGLEFNPANYSRLELDGDDAASVIADANFRAEISERMTAKLVSAIADLALKEGKTDIEKREAADRIAKLAGLKRKLDDGELNAEAFETALMASAIETE